MYLERLLQINMAVLATFGAVLLGMGQRNEAQPLLVALAAAASVWLTDITGWVRIGRRMANVLMLVAGLVSIREISALGSELQTLGLAWFVVCLQIILLFQEKDQRIYWLLVILSLLQVVVATLFNQGVLFGALLAAYMFVAFTAMSLLLLYQQWESYRATVGGDSSRRKSGVSRTESATGVASYKKTPCTRSVPTTVRWPLASATAGLLGVPGGGSRAGLRPALFVRLARMAIATLGITLILFLALPRTAAVTWRGVVAEGQKLVGFSDRVTLGELGEILESREEVMRVRLLEPSGGAISSPPGEIYLHGATLMTYEAREMSADGSELRSAGGTWQTGMPVWDARVQSLRKASSLPDRDLVIQEIRLEPSDRDELFYIDPFVPLNSTDDIRFNYTEQRLLRAEHLRARQFGYRLGTTAVVGGMQKPLTPSGPKDATRSARRMPGGDGAKTLPRLVALANRWIEESKLPESNRIGRAQYLERKLSMSGQFQYSLVGQERNPDIDPIEDFVSEHPAGHCEYFATALTLMLRSQGIPARMVVGYKCDEWNAAGGFYQVRQLHAHTWVEAYLSGAQVPPGLTHGGDYWRWADEGGWLRLDPTPAGAGREEQATLLSPLRHGLDWLDSGWSNYVVELDFQRQRDAIYQPISRAVQSAWHAATDVERWKAMLGPVLVALHLDQLGGAAAWIGVTVLLIIAAAILAAAGWLLWRAMRPMLIHWKARRSGVAVARRSNVEFYRRFESILSRQGVVRAAGQTQRQFAVVAAARLANVDGQPDITALPARIVEAFYRIRFGHEGLDNPEAEAVEHALVQLAAAARKIV